MQIGTTDANFTKRIQDMEEIVSGIEENTEEMGISHTVKTKMFLIQIIQWGIASSSEEILSEQNIISIAIKINS